MRKELPKQYDPTQVESQIYQMWLDNDCFKAEPDPGKTLFHRHAAPNVTGQLHMGHALDSTLQDILTAQADGGLQRPLGCPAPIMPVLPPRLRSKEELRVKGRQDPL